MLGLPDLTIIAKILHTDVNSGHFKSTVEGNYKGRIINVKEHHSSEGSKIDFRVIPLKVPREQKKFMINYPKPTKYTHIKDGIINFDFPHIWQRDTYKGKWNEEQLSKVFDEMIEAAEIVESDAQFYKGKLGEKKELKDLVASDGSSFSSSLQKKDQKDTIKLIAVIVFSASCAILITIAFGMIFLPDFRERFFQLFG